LQGPLAHKGLLNDVERLSIAQTFKGRYLTAGDANRKHEARTDGATVEQYGAGSARSNTAALPHAPEFESVAQDFEQRVSVLDDDRLFSPVDFQGYFALHSD
jgi:hypothetical protein